MGVLFRTKAFYPVAGIFLAFGFSVPIFEGVRATAALWVHQVWGQTKFLCGVLCGSCTAIGPAPPSPPHRLPLLPKSPIGHPHPINTNKDLQGHPRGHHSRHGAGQDPQQQHGGGGQPGPHPPSGAQDGGRATNGHQRQPMTTNGAEVPAHRTP